MTVSRTITRNYTTSEMTEKTYCDYFKNAVENFGLEYVQPYEHWVNWLIDFVADETLINDYGITVEEEDNWNEV